MSLTTTATKPKPGFSPWPRTSVGTKFWVAVTGVGLVGYVIIHMLGNLQIYLGPEAINHYAHLLKSNPELLWAARTGLLAIFVIHIVLAIRLKRTTFATRPKRYVMEQHLATTTASRYMLLTGMVVLAFVLYHLAHFTVGWVQPVPQTDPATGETVLVNMLDLRDAEGRHDVYSMVVHGFRQPVISITYILAQLVLGMHLYHGASSMLQTLGLNNGRFNGLLRKFGPAIAIIVVVGNISIPVAIWTGLVPLLNGG